MQHAHQERERISRNILSMYSNSGQLTTKEMSVEEFQKAYPTESFSIITNDIMKSYVKDVIEKAKDDRPKNIVDTERYRQKVEKDKTKTTTNKTHQIVYTGDDKFAGAHHGKQFDSEEAAHKYIKGTISTPYRQHYSVQKNSNTIQKAADEINSYEKIIVKAENGASKLFYVKEKNK